MNLEAQVVSLSLAEGCMFGGGYVVGTGESFSVVFPKWNESKVK